MDSTIWGTIIGFVAAVLSRYLPTPPVITGESEGEVPTSKNTHPTHHHHHHHKPSKTDILKTYVRPGLTIAFFALFAGIKIYAIHHAFSVDGDIVKDVLPVIWDQTTGEIFGIVMGFWFGSRIPRK